MSAASAAKPEIVIGVVAADLAAEVRAHQIGVAVVEAGEDAGFDDVVDRVVEAGVGAGGAGDAWAGPCRCRRTLAGP